jgi:hypothetical protein
MKKGRLLSNYSLCYQIISQTNECGNYWFPVNIICSNLNSQIQGDENDVAMATTTTPDSDTNYGAPFP